ncbi:methyl-accepting chemotaxis protein [Thioclava sp. GXIMD4216]|uniref:methyl-accepting chemotaxis protein n=1 Tax=Thioclava sp. GXIMD4216 TaxID=3131929 RepID=UPI0030D5F5EE
MRVLDNVKIGVKLPLILFTIALVALSVMALTAYRDSRHLLEQAATERLMHVAQVQADRVNEWEADFRTEVKDSIASDFMRDTLRDFQNSWTRLGEGAADQVRSAYVEGNAYRAEDRWKLTAAADGSLYSKRHEKYHPMILQQAKRAGFSDIYLISAEGDVLYSIEKADDFGTNFVTGPFADSKLGQLVQKALKASTENPQISEATIHETDHAGVLSYFMAAPILDHAGNPKGALAFEIPLSGLNAILADGRGLQETGQSYLVDQNMKYQNNLRLSQVPTVMQAAPENPAITRALAGESGTVDAAGVLDGSDATAAFLPISFMNHPAALIVEQSDKELFSPIIALAKSMSLHGAIVLVALVLLATLMARSISKPLVRLKDTMDRLAAKDYDLVVPFTRRKDEVGRMAVALEDFQIALATAEAASKDVALKGAAFNAGSSSMMMADTNFNISYVNPAMTHLIENRLEDFQVLDQTIEADTMVGRSIDTFHKNPQRIRDFLSDSANLPYSANLKIGQAQFALGISEVVMPGEGRIGYVVEWRDITEIGMSRAMLKALDSAQMLGEADLNGRISSVNENYCKAVGISAEEFIGRPVADVTSTVDSEFTIEDVAQRVMSEGVSVTGTWKISAGDGRDAISEGIIAPVHDEIGDVVKVVFIGSDVTTSRKEIARAAEQTQETSRRQAKVVETLRVGLSALSDGNLTAKIAEHLGDEYEELRADFNTAVDRLAEAMRVVIDNAVAIDNEAREISNAAEDLSRRTEQQAATLEETAAALDELTSSVASASDGINEADRIVMQARKDAESSGQVVQQAVEAMGEISESSQKISKIISVIDDIAFQTNLLALNAGVEAARAGEAGRGFAVVASEVRALAQRSSEAAREIDGLITASSDQVSRGVGLVGQAGNALETILHSVTDIAERVGRIATSAKEQASGLSEINTSVNQLDQVTQHNAAMFEETTAASQSLSQSANALNETTRRFSIDNHAKPAAASAKPAPKAVASKATGAPGTAAKPASKPAMPKASVPVVEGNLARQVPPAPSSDDWEDF